MFAIKLLSRLPLSVLYALSDFLFFVSFHIVKYRRKLVWKNLKNSFPSKSEGELKKIEKEISGNWNIKKFIAIHRIGYLKVGEISVIVGVSSEHRKEAFEACSYGIDNIKKRCPIWKKEEMESGDSEWVQGVMINE